MRGKGSTSIFQNPKPALKDMLRPGKIICCAPLIMNTPPSENPESDRRKLGDDMFPMGVPLLMILNILLTLRLKLRVCLGGFLFFVSSLKPNLLEMDELKLKLLGALPKFRGMILSPGRGFGSRTP